MLLEVVGCVFESLFEGCVLIKVDWVKLFVCWCIELEECIYMLQLLCDELIGCIGCGCLLLQYCCLVNFGDVFGECGDGLMCWE